MLSFCVPFLKLQSRVKTIGFTSPTGVQLMMTTDVVEIYEKGSLQKTIDLTKNKCETRASANFRFF